MCQYCENYHYLRKKYYFSNTFNEAIKFEKKYYEAFKENEEYKKIEKIDDMEEKLYQFVIFAFVIKNKLQIQHPSPFDENLYTIIESKSLFNEKLYTIIKE
ncbi:hypothetical protein F8M41_024368 [Gigaspora margarita]|uniref:Uncharacterized protein n=1 Tax=Gigaspora margarita TaxID=4874 RepID=A0A8H3XKE3_GIGMA|nr:hypothetical protein F8M41_024368 [Gigaspora margarita]